MPTGNTAKFDAELVKRYYRMMNGAKSRDVYWNLPLSSLRNAIKAKKCFYTGEPISIDFPQGHPNQLTIDRKDPTKGYVKGNIVACSHNANNLKNAYEIDGQKSRREINNTDVLKRIEKDVKVLMKMAKAVSGG